jgi:hypothetical protein
MTPRKRHAWIADSVAGRLLGLRRSDIGTVGQLIVLRSFKNQADLAGERERALMSTNPFGSAKGGNPLTMDSFAPFPFLPPVKARDYGGTFELRTYVQKPGGLPGTMDGWRAAIEPAKAYTDHLVVNMYALDGAPRITHIWDLRALLSATGYASSTALPISGHRRAVPSGSRTLRRLSLDQSRACRSVSSQDTSAPVSRRLQSSKRITNMQPNEAVVGLRDAQALYGGAMGEQLDRLAVRLLDVIAME